MMYYTRTTKILRYSLVRILAAALFACARSPITSTPTRPPYTDVRGTPVSASAALLAQEDVVPDELTVRIYTHTILAGGEELPAWTLVSDGLARHDQMEVVFTVLRGPGEAASAFPKDLLKFYATLNKLAANHRLVTPGGMSEFPPSERSLMGRPDFRGVYYAPGQLIPGVPLVAPFLTALAITDKEIEQIREFGQVRFLTGLGLSTGYFPFPPWNDRQRPGGQPLPDSLLNKGFARGTLAGMTVGLELADAPSTHGTSGPQQIDFTGSRIVLRLAPEFPEMLAETIQAADAGNTVILFADLDVSADGVLAVKPGDESLRVLSCSRQPVARISANFVILAPSDEDKDEAFHAEDGFTVFFRESTWKRLHEALADHTPISVPIGDGMTFTVEWLSTRDYSPFMSYCLK